MEMSVITWLISGVVAICLELVVPGFVLMFFGCGAILTAVSLWAFPAMSVTHQVLIFTISSIVLLIAFRKMLRNKFFNKNAENNDEDFVGKTAIATSDFLQNAGTVEFKGVEWKALSSESIAKGDTVVITKHESITLFVNKL